MVGVSHNYSLTVEDWHQRSLQQASWTRNLREYLIRRTAVNVRYSFLEVGFGTGAILLDLFLTSRHQVYGLDFNLDSLFYAVNKIPKAKLTCGDAYDLPYPRSSFDVCLCHYLLLWLSNPEIALSEMIRVTRSGGIILVFAEPDYGGRIDFPEELTILRDWQTSSLQRQGADPFMGRKLRELFNQSAMLDVEVGVLGGEWKSDIASREIDMEWKVIRSDLSTDPEKSNQLDMLESVDKKAWVEQARILYLPTFYAWGRVP